MSLESGYDKIETGLPSTEGSNRFATGDERSKENG
jgi:hypothetical protein